MLMIFAIYLETLYNESSSYSPFQEEESEEQSSQQGEEDDVATFLNNILGKIIFAILMLRFISKLFQPFKVDEVEEF